MYHDYFIDYNIHITEWKICEFKTNKSGAQHVWPSTNSLVTAIWMKRPEIHINPFEHRYVNRIRGVCQNDLERLAGSGKSLFVKLRFCIAYH